MEWFDKAYNWVATPNGNLAHDTLLDFSSHRATCRTLSTFAGCVPVIGNAVAVGGELTGIYYGLKEGKESKWKVLGEGAVGIGISLIPFGKVIGGFGKVGIRATENALAKAAVKEGEKIVEKTIEKSTEKEIADVATKTLEPLTKKGVSATSDILLSGMIKKVFGSLTQTELKALEKETGEKIAQAMAEKGLELSEEEATKIVSKVVWKQMLKKDLARGLVRGVSDYFMEKYSKDQKIGEENVVVEAKVILDKHNKDHGTELKYDDLDEEVKSGLIRNAYDNIKKVGVEVTDKSGKPLTADEVVQHALQNEQPEKAKAEEPLKPQAANSKEKTYEIPATRLADYRVRPPVQSQQAVIG